MSQRISLPAVTVLACCILLATGVYATPWMKPPVPGWTLPCRVIRVIDGDTIEVEITHRLNVRLIDCWAPESRTTNAAEKVRGLASKTNLQQIVSQQSVGTIYIPAPASGNLSDTFTLGRVLGHVWLQDNEKSLSQRQVEAGHASKEKAK